MIEAPATPFSSSTTRRTFLLCRVNLEFERYHVVTASSGVEGLGPARDIRPGLVLLDVMMPTMDGWHVLESLKSDPATAEIPVIMLTARVRGEDQMRGWSGGATDYIMKAERRRERSLEKLRLLNSL